MLPPSPRGASILTTVSRVSRVSQNILSGIVGNGNGRITPHCPERGFPRFPNGVYIYPLGNGNRETGMPLVQGFVFPMPTHAHRLPLVRSLGHLSLRAKTKENTDQRARLGIASALQCP